MKIKGFHAKARSREDMPYSFFVPLRLCVKQKDIAAARRWG